MKRVLFLATIISCFSGNVSAGYGDSAGSDNYNAEGAPASIKILSSYKTEAGRTVVDVGFGVQNYHFVHGSAIERSISASVMELATRYQFENQWQLGVVYNQVFGKGENFYANQADVVLGESIKWPN